MNQKYSNKFGKLINCRNPRAFADKMLPYMVLRTMELNINKTKIMTLVAEQKKATDGKNIEQVNTFQFLRAKKYLSKRKLKY